MCQLCVCVCQVCVCVVLCASCEHTVFQQVAEETCCVVPGPHEGPWYNLLLVNKNRIFSDVLIQNRMFSFTVHCFDQ